MSRTRNWTRYSTGSGGVTAGTRRGRGLYRVSPFFLRPRALAGELRPGEAAAPSWHPVKAGLTSVGDVFSPKPPLLHAGSQRSKKAVMKTMDYVQPQAGSAEKTPGDFCRICRYTSWYRKMAILYRRLCQFISSHWRGRNYLCWVLGWRPLCHSYTSRKGGHLWTSGCS
jgi:hypothetical protein